MPLDRDKIAHLAECFDDTELDTLIAATCLDCHHCSPFWLGAQFMAGGNSSGATMFGSNGWEAFTTPEHVDADLHLGLPEVANWYDAVAARVEAHLHAAASDHPHP